MAFFSGNELASSSRKSWLPSPLRMLMIACAMVLLSVGALGYRYVQRRMAALSYLGSQKGLVITALPKGWAAVPLPKGMRTYEYVQVVDCPCDFRQFTALDEIQHLDCLGCRIDHRAAGSLAAFRQLESLTFQHTDVMDGDLIGLENCRRLSAVDCICSKLTDEGLAELGKLPLKRLDLAGTPITDAGLEHLTHLPLEQLTLSGTRITDEGMGSLAKCRGLRTLCLNDTRITDAGLEHLAGLALVSLDIANTRISDRGLSTLKSLPLGRLTIYETDVTIEAMSLLNAMRGLTFVCLSRETFSEESTAALRARSVQVSYAPIKFSSPDAATQMAEESVARGARNAPSARVGE